MQKKKEKKKGRPKPMRPPISCYRSGGEHLASNCLSSQKCRMVLLQESGPFCEHLQVITSSDKETRKQGVEVREKEASCVSKDQDKETEMRNTRCFLLPVQHASLLYKQ